MRNLHRRINALPPIRRSPPQSGRPHPSPRTGRRSGARRRSAPAARQSTSSGGRHTSHRQSCAADYGGGRDQVAAGKRENRPAPPRTA